MIRFVLFVMLAAAVSVALPSAVLSSDTAQATDKGSALKAFIADTADKEARQMIVTSYKSSTAEEQTKTKNALQDAYYKLIKTDPAGAKRCRDLYMELVGIASANSPVFSYCVGVQMPTAFAKEKYIIGKGRPSQLVASEIMMDMGSDILKLAPGAKQLERDGNAMEVRESLNEIIKQPTYKKILDLPYRVMFFWAHGGGDKLHARQMTESEKADLYKEIFEFTKYLLTTYNDSGKTFMIGNWEGDWMAGGKEVGDGKSLEDARIRTMIDWMNTRARAIDDAKAQVPHKNVFVYSYLEINHVNRARTSGIKRLVNSVLPYTSVDYVSISSYEMQGFGILNKLKTEAAIRERIFANLNYVQDNLPPRDIFGKRVFIGEIGYTTEHIQGASKGFSKEQVQKEQARLALLDAKLNLEWGTPFWLWWAVHNTKGGSFGIVDERTGEKTVLYDELKKYYKWAGDYASSYRKDKGQLPEPDAFRKAAIGQLDKQIGELARQK